MTPQELRASILQQAIQGKLVEQRPEEGTGEELFQKIQVERQALIKAGKLKKEKPLPGIAEDEIPFDIPETWKWLRLGSVVSVLGGKRIPAGRTLTTEDTGYKYIRVSDMKNGSVLVDNLLYVPTDIYPSISKYIINKEDVYLTVAGTIGRVGKIPEEIDGANLTENADRLVFQLIDQDWLINCLESSLVQQQITDATTKVGQPKLAIWRIQELLVPLPPIAEQKRIVTKLGEILPLIDRYEVAWNKLEEFNKRFPGDMQKSILQLAIQGKLVEQRPEEGTGEELFQQIQTEKQALIKAGTIKKEKPLPEITEDEIPFDIPDTWKWVKLKDLGITQTGNTPSKAHPEYFGSDIPFVSPGDIQNGMLYYENQALSLLGKEVGRVCNKGSILQVCIGGSIGKAAITDREVTFNQQINAISPILVDSHYLFAVMQSQYFIATMKAQAGGTATPIINRGLWDALLIPVPPLAEQKRIVAKLEEILPLCDRLK